MKHAPLTVTLYIGGKQVENLTDAECERIAQRLSETMSLYYTANPKEFARLNE